MPDTTTRPRWAGAAALVLAGVLAGCGGEGSGQPPVAAAPGPASGPTPAPSPTPTPAAERDPRFASAAVGDQVFGPAVCADAPVTHDASGATTGIGPIASLSRDASLAITYVGKDSYRLELNGFTGFAFKPENRQPFPSSAYARYVDPFPAELLLSQYDLQFVVLGTYADTVHCFFAAGLTGGSLPTIAVSYSGIVDGLAVIGGKQSRIFSGSANDATMNFDFASRTGTISFRLIQRADTFGNFEASPPVDLGTVTANLTVAAGQKSISAPLSGAGFTGTVRGLFVDNGNSILGKDISGAGVALVYELRSPAGDLIYGTVAFGANLI